MAVFFVICVILFGNYGCRFHQRSDVDSWYTSKSTFVIRVRESQETRYPLNRFCYTFEAARRDSINWRQVVETCTDDDITIPRDWVRFITDENAYITAVDKFAITTNGGNTWFVWKVAQAEIPGAWFIKNVEVHSDGTGVLILASGTDTDLTKELHTNDFGHSWK